MVTILPVDLSYHPVSSPSAWKTFWGRRCWILRAFIFLKMPFLWLRIWRVILAGCPFLLWSSGLRCSVGGQHPSHCCSPAHVCHLCRFQDFPLSFWFSAVWLWQTQMWFSFCLWVCWTSRICEWIRGFRKFSAIISRNMFLSPRPLLFIPSGSPVTQRLDCLNLSLCNGDCYFLLFLSSDWFILVTHPVDFHFRHYSFQLWHFYLLWSFRGSVRCLPTPLTGKTGLQLQTLPVTGSSQPLLSPVDRWLLFSVAFLSVYLAQSQFGWQAKTWGDLQAYFRASLLVGSTFSGISLFFQVL